MKEARIMFFILIGVTSDCEPVSGQKQRFVPTFDALNISAQI